MTTSIKKQRPLHHATREAIRLERLALAKGMPRHQERVQDMCLSLGCSRSVATRLLAARMLMDNIGLEDSVKSERIFLGQNERGEA